MTAAEQTFDSALCDRALSVLGSAARSWVGTELAERIALLERMLPLVLERAEATVAAAAAAKGYGPESPWAAEDWAGGPWALTQNINAMLRVMRRIAGGRPALAPGAVTRREGRTWVEVFPASGWDRLLLSGFNASPRTERDQRPAVRAAVDELRYGTLGINCWSGAGFLLGYTPWGAHPGHSRQDIGSGTGFVHNAFQLEGVEKTVVRAPFAPAPRGVFTGSPSLSPRPPYFVTSRTGIGTLRQLVPFTAAPNVLALPGIFASALRG